jgi:hypothetical protein
VKTAVAGFCLAKILKKLSYKFNTKKIMNSFSKFAKGICTLIALNLLVVAGSIIFNSCKKSDLENSKAGQANAKFRSALALNGQTIGSISFDKQIITQGTRVFLPANDSVVYIKFPDKVFLDVETSFKTTNSIRELSDLVLITDAVIQAEPIGIGDNVNYAIDISVKEVTEALDPLVLEAKQYLYSKGFTDRSIQDMINEHNGTEHDLVAYVMTLTNIENNQNMLAQSNLNLFVNQTYAMNQYVRCALIAIGADVLWALGGSSAATWSVKMMTKAFGAVAKRFLGPIGVAIAVVSFGVCLATD